MSAKELPTLDSGEKLFGNILFDSTPIQTLAKDEIKQELDHWQRQLEARYRIEFEKRANPGLKGYVVGWGVLAIAVVGVVVAHYLDSIVGDFVAISGFCLSSYERYDNWEIEKQDRSLYEPARLAKKRREELIQELEKRFHSKPTPTKLSTP